MVRRSPLLNPVTVGCATYGLSCARIEFQPVGRGGFQA